MGLDLNKTKTASKIFLPNENLAKDFIYLSIHLKAFPNICDTIIIIKIPLRKSQKNTVV